MKDIIESAKQLGEAILCAIVRTALKVDRKFWKAYLNIETPLYKEWWKWRAKRNQELLDLDKDMIL